MQSENEADLKLIERAKAGDRASIGELLEQNAAYLRSVIRNDSSFKVLTWLEIDDLLQVVFLKVFLSIDTFRTGGIEGFRRWIATITHHTIIDAARAIKTLPIVPFDPEESHRALAELAFVDSRSPSRNVAGTEARAQLDQAITKLPDACRVAITLYDLEGKKYEEVAKEMGCSVSKAFTTRLRGLVHLRASLS